MGTEYGNRSIVTSGLTLCLDAGNLKSYPTTGTTWTDLTKISGNGTLTNMGVTGFSSSNSGVLVFDGVNDYVILNNVIPISDSTKSVFMWFKSTGNISTRQWLFYSGTETVGGRFALEIESSRFTFNYYSQAIQGIVLTTNTWYYGGVTYNSTTKQLSIYLNGVLTSTTTFPVATVSLNTGNGSFNYIGNIFNATVPLNGNISNVQVYNRALSASEVLQNYNATKWRFQ
jgi:hypothetical protein